MKQLRYFSLVILFGALCIVACDDNSGQLKNGPDPVTGHATVVLQFDNVAGDQDLVLDKGSYVNSQGEDFTVSRFNYFVSNIRLLLENGGSYTIPQDSSYFRILESDPKSQIVTLKHIPEGPYTGIEYVLGVDSLRSVSGIEKLKGALDPSGDHGGDGMYWAWNSGYIFLKLEGSSSKGSPVNGKYYYHIGFFGGYNERTVNNLRTIRVDFGGNKLIAGEDSVAQVRIKADVQKVFNGSSDLSIAQHPGIMFDDSLSSKVANNYKSMFSFGEIKYNGLQQ